MSKWEIRVHFYNGARGYMMHSNATLTNAKANIMRRIKGHEAVGFKVYAVVIRDLSVNNKVHYRIFMGRSARHNWVSLFYCEKAFPERSDWDRAFAEDMK